MKNSKKNWIMIRLYSIDTGLFKIQMFIQFDMLTLFKPTGGQWQQYSLSGHKAW